MKKNMNNKGQADAGVNKMLFIGILFIIGVVLFVIISGLVSEQTTLVPRSETNLGYNGTVSITLADIPVNEITSFLDNSSSAVLVEGANYTLDRVNGIISNQTDNVIANGSTDGERGYNVNYTSEPAGFIEPGTSRTIVVIIPVLFLLALIIFVFAAQGKGGKNK